MTNRTICCLAVSFAAGLLYGETGNVGLCLGVTGFLLWRTLSLIRQNGRKTAAPAMAAAILGMLVFMAGEQRYGTQQEKFSRAEQYAKEQEYIKVQGRIYWKEQKKEQFIYYLNNAGIIAGKKSYPCGRIQVYSSKDAYQIGSCLQVEGQYEAFALPRNEGNFNEKQYYYSKNINLRIKAYQEQQIDGHTDIYRVWLLKVRRQMEQVFQCNMSERTWGIMANMVLGSRNLAEPEIKALYQKAGISHVLAVSGLHVSLFGMGVYRLLRRIYCPLPLASVAAAGVVYSFGMLTGMELSTVRAVSMFLLMMAAGTLGYTYDTLTALGVSALLQLWDNPFALWYAGFLLSYTAVFGAVVIAGGLSSYGKGKSRFGKKMKDTLRTGICIQISTLPLLLYFYYEVSGYSVLVNGGVLPFMEILLFMGAVGGSMGMFHKGMAAVLLKIPECLLEGWEAICSFCAGLPGNSIITGRPSVEKIIIYYVLLAVVLYAALQRGKKRYLCMAAVLAVFLCSGNQKLGTEADFLDVGQGDGIFLQTEQGKGVFVDGGSTDIGKAGTYRILPFLKYRGIREISLWFVSHTDKDHISGLKEILEEGYPVRNIVFAKGIVQDEAWRSLAETARKNGSNICYIGMGERIQLEEARFTVLYPQETGRERNQSSMVVLAELAGMTGILTGDIGKEQEEEILNNKEIWKYLKTPITFYKAAHHGADGSNSSEFLERLSPGIAVISCGENNPYGHPGKEAVKRMEESGMRIYVTMENGQIQLVREKGRNCVTYTNFK